MSDTKKLPEIFLLTPDFRPLTGGVAEYLHNLFDQVALRYPVTVVSTVPTRGKDWGRSYKLINAPIESAERSQTSRFLLLRKFNAARRMLASRRRAERIIAPFKASSGTDLRVYIGWWSTASHWWCRALREAGMPYSIFAYGTDIAKPAHRRVARWRAEDFRNAAQVLAISEGTADLARLHFGADTKINLIRPGVMPLPATDLESRGAHLRSQFNVEGSHVLLTLCRLIPRKGVDLVLHSIASLSLEYPDLVYVVAGSGPEGARLQELAKKLKIEDRVRFVGHIEEEDKDALYDLADVFVLPNRLMSGEDWEGFGIVFLEAARAGTPAIGGNNGGVPDAICHGKTGLLVDPEQEGELTAALRRMLGNSELRRRMGQAARHRAEEEFRWTRTVEIFTASV